MLQYLFIVACFLCFLHILFNYNRDARLMKKMPGPKGVFILGHALENFSRTSVELFDFFRELAARYPKINCMWAFPYSFVNVYQPEDIEILTSGTKHNKKNMFYKFLLSWLQDGLLISHGDKWHKRRKILTPAFNGTVLKQFCAVFEENGRRLIEVLRASQGKPVDLRPTLSDCALHTICETAMGIKLQDESTKSVKSYIDALLGIGQIFVERSRRVYYFPDFMYNLSLLKRQEMKYANVIHGFTKKIVDAKTNTAQQDANKGDDCVDKTSQTPSKRRNVAFLDLLLSLQKDGLIDQQGVYEEVNTFMFEGHDTTSGALIFTFMLLANYKHVQDKLVQELNEIFGESDRAPTMEDFISMRYLERCIKESLRLYPPVALMGRVLSEDTILSGYVVPAGSHCVIQAYDIHRREDLYRNPLVFDPDRFLPENSVGRHPYAYIPFSAGPRNCIGQKFAMLEMKSVLSTVIRQFAMEPVTKPEDLKFRIDLILKSTVPVEVRFTARNKRI